MDRARRCPTSLSATRRWADGRKRCLNARNRNVALSPLLTSWRESPGRSCGVESGSSLQECQGRRKEFGGPARRLAAADVCETVTTRWPDSRTALRKPGLKNGARRRDFYEDRSARISILAGGCSSRPDTLKQTDQPGNLGKTPLQTGRATQHRSCFNNVSTARRKPS